MQHAVAAYFRQMFFINAFEPSSCAAAAVGPNAVMPASARLSASPSTSGCSGPTSTNSTPFCLQKSMTCCERGRSSVVKQVLQQLQRSLSQAALQRAH